MTDDQFTFEAGRFTESELESAIIELFCEHGYQHVDGEQLHRRFDEVLLRDDLEAFLLARYRDQQFSETELQKIINRLDLLNAPSLYEANRSAHRLVVEGFDFARDDNSQIAVHVDFIDFEHPERNTFKVVNQYTVVDQRNRRPDLLVFVNGIPVTVFEFKTAIEEHTTIYDAWEQISIRYTRDVPKLLKYAFLAVISDGANNRLGSIFTPYEYFYSWNKANELDTVANGISSLVTLIDGVFTQDRLLQILRDFVFYPDNSSTETAIVCRYPQFFAANNMLASIRDHMRPHGDGKGGVYFGATGSGKTYTMLYLARLLMLRDAEAFKNPTIVVIVDREDLDSQTSKIFAAAKQFLHDDSVRSIESREDLARTLRNKPSGGVYVTTIQKFSESIGLLSDRSNIICISDEAHRTQTGVGAKLRSTDEGVFTTYGFAKYLRDSFPNATYCGFTGTPIDETVAVFGDIVDAYTMRQSSEDGITVRIAYEPRLARVVLSDEKTKEIQAYYDHAADLGATEEAIEESQRAMSAMRVIIGDPDRLRMLAQDLVKHYESLVAEKPNVVQKAMVVCTDRSIAFRLTQEIIRQRPEWGAPRKAADESSLSKDQLDELVALPLVNLVVTQGANDPKDLYEAAGNKEYRKMLDAQFKNNASNFRIAVVVDMWITGFDVPSLAVMYIDKPLQRHTLVQTISRVNRVFEGKDKGLVVDYIGIKKQMMQALKQYGDTQESPVDEIEVSVGVFRNQLALLDELFNDFDTSKYFRGSPLERLLCLNQGAEFIQQSAENQQRFMFITKRMKGAYQIVLPTGELSDSEIAKAQFYMAIRSIIYKQTKGDAPDAEIMNKTVEKMVADAISTTGVESIIDDDKSVDLFGDEMIEKLKRMKMPITKFNALLMLLKQSIRDYRKTNKVKAAQFEERLTLVVERYNSRDDVFVSEVVEDFINDLSDQIITILHDLQEDQNSFEAMGISYEEKAFYDILIKVRDDHEFEYADDKCIPLAKAIKKLVDDKSQYADWAGRSDVKSMLNRDITILLYKNGYPPQWKKEVFDQIMEQAENFKKYQE
ncbi:type I restriction endonuclease [Actinotignum sanguinis]|uniref:type I restriction endonuclease subunit R n=1 Tax=Actinotignum sanguinis TaxID=1445614 RepID=UPI000F7EBFC9|nr:HsdR family type I site-specific deoxyribonuclease [Actinotignum sanguinis]MDY5148001.1 HsdR family type I site-specific deoxyribonuclease [Actinotignum sanguinis]RTE50037.1 type I restriction endonuclease [Actinotignum sanguinis]